MPPSDRSRAIPERRKAQAPERERDRARRGTAPSACLPAPARRSPSELRPSPGAGGEAERRQGGGAPARWEPEGLSPASPRSVTPGIETQSGSSRVPEPGIYVGIDWIRCTGPDWKREDVGSFIHERFGGDAEVNNGAQWFKHGVVWKPGIMLSWGHRSGICQLDVQGERLRLLDGTERVELLDALMMMGLKATRLDGCIDWIAQDVSICENATASCERGELCILRKYSPNHEFTAAGYPTRRLLKLGSRGSPVCARIYDKGLEQKIAPPGYWERFEVEWKADRAPQAARLICDAGADWPRALASLIFGAVEFRVANGRSELDRRPLTDWWVTLIRGIERVRTAPEAPDASFERWAKWFRQACGGRLLEMSEAVGVPAGSIVEWLLDGENGARRGGPVLEGFLRSFA